MEPVLSVASFSIEFEHCRQDTARPSSRQSTQNSEAPTGDLYHAAQRGGGRSVSPSERALCCKGLERQFGFIVLTFSVVISLL